MKRIIAILVLLLVFTIKINAQFSFNKFIDEAVVKPGSSVEFNMAELLKNAVDAKLDKIAVKVVNAKLKDGKVAIKAIANANLTDKEAKKLNDILKVKLTAKLGKTAKENVVDGVKNNLWVKTDGTRYTLTYSGNMTMLVILKK